MVETLVIDAMKRTDDMNEKPQRPVPQVGTHDGLAAVAIAILAVCLIALVISQVV